MNPTGPKDEGWFEWAEAETIRRLRRQIAERRAIAMPPPPAPDRIVIEAPADEIRLEAETRRVIRIHEENLLTT